MEKGAGPARGLPVQNLREANQSQPRPGGTAVIHNASTIGPKRAATYRRRRGGWASGVSIRACPAPPSSSCYPSSLLPTSVLPEAPSRNAPAPPISRHRRRLLNGRFALTDQFDRAGCSRYAFRSRAAHARRKYHIRRAIRSVTLVPSRLQHSVLTRSLGIHRTSSIVALPLPSFGFHSSEAAPSATKLPTPRFRPLPCT